MKQYPVMAVREFDHKGTRRKAGQCFYMSEVDYELWGAFVRIIPSDKVPTPRVTKEGGSGTRNTG